jgi:hypothetical protein
MKIDHSCTGTEMTRQWHLQYRSLLGYYGNDKLVPSVHRLWLPFNLFTVSGLGSILTFARTVDSEGCILHMYLNVEYGTENRHHY